MPIDRSTLPSTIAPLDPPSAADAPPDAGPVVTPSGSGSLSPRGALAFLPRSPVQARHAPRGGRAATPQFGGNDALSAAADQPIVRGPRFQRALLQQFDEMRLHDSASSSSTSSIDEGESDTSDDFLVKAESSLAGHPDFWSGGARRAQRREALQEWVALSSIPADAQALADGADELRRQAETLHPISATTDFRDVFQNFDIHGPLRKTLFECEDAGRSWQTAADQYHAALDVARKVGLSSGELERLEGAAAHCYAQTERFAIKAWLLTGIIQYKRNRHGVERGDLRALKMVLTPLRAALDHCESDALRALPLDSAPVEGFDAELQTISDALGRRSAAGAMDTRPQWAEQRDSAVSSLGYVLSALPLLLRGDLNVPALLGTLRSALTAPMGHARELLAAAEARPSDPSRSLGDLTARFESWYEAARAYDDALRVFGDSTASWPDAARSAPEAQQWRADLVGARDSALLQTREALIGLFSTMATLTRESLATDPDPTAGIGALTTEELLINVDLLSRCQTLRGKLQASTFPQDAGGFDAGRLALPFAALEQYCESMLGRDANMLDAANNVRKAALAADSAVSASGRVWGPALRQFSADCARQRTRLLNSAFQIAHDDSVNFSVQASAAMTPALQCVYELRQSLPVVWFDPSPKERAAAQEAEAAERELIASSREAARDVQAHIARMPSPPADANTAIIENHANLQLNLSAIATAQHTLAELIECCAQARRTIHEGPTAGCAAHLQRLAGQAQRAGDRAADVLALGRNRHLTRGVAGERALRTLQFTRRLARAARSIHYTLGVLADISDVYQRAQTLSREPILDPLRFQQAAERQTAVVDSAAKDIDATRKQLIASVGTRHPTEHAATIAAREIEEIESFTLGLEWRYVADFDSAKRQWLRATVRALTARLAGPPDAVPPAADALLDLIDQHLAAGTKILISASRVDRNERITSAVRENYEIRREVQDCRDQLKRVPVRARAATGAGSSRPDKQKDKKASAKARRR